MIRHHDDEVSSRGPPPNSVTRPHPRARRRRRPPSSGARKSSPCCRPPGAGPLRASARSSSCPARRGSARRPCSRRSWRRRSSSLAKAWVARGQCVEQYGTGEPFLPILEGIGRLCRAPGGSRIVTLLHRHAPSWLVQLPGLTGAAEQAALERRYAGSGRERMLDEMVAGLEALTAHAPLVLVLEDLHWSDRSTLTLLAALARRSEPARVLVLGTYRPAEAATIDHPLRATVQELISRRRGQRDRARAARRGQCRRVPDSALRRRRAGSSAGTDPPASDGRQSAVHGQRRRPSRRL